TCRTCTPPAARSARTSTRSNRRASMNYRHRTSVVPGRRMRVAPFAAAPRRSSNPTECGSMSSIPFPILLLFVLFGFMWYLMRKQIREGDAKRGLPQRADYLAAHALAAPACHACGGTELKDEGLNSGT